MFEAGTLSIKYFPSDHPFRETVSSGAETVGLAAGVEEADVISEEADSKSDLALFVSELSLFAEVAVTVTSSTDVCRAVCGEEVLPGVWARNAVTALPAIIVPEIIPINNFDVAI